MTECPNCGNELKTKAIYHKRFACRECDATLRVTATSSALPICLILAFVGFALSFIFLPPSSFIFLAILVPGLRIASLFTKVEVVQKNSSMAQQEIGARGRLNITSEGLVPETGSSKHRDAQNEDQAWRYCICCGSEVVEEEFEFCVNCGASIARLTAETSPCSQDESTAAQNSAAHCMVCGSAIADVARILSCPHCGNVAHRVHLLEWLHVKACCPACAQPLTEREISQRKREKGEGRFDRDV